MSVFKNKQNGAKLVCPYKKRSIASITAFLFMLLGFTYLTTACQPTPDIDVVVGHQNDDEMIKDASVSSFIKADVPEHVDETFDEYAKLRVIFDAEVVVPETTMYPVTEVAPRNLTDDDLLSMIEILAGESDSLYSQWNLTKDEWLEKMAKVKSFKGTEKFSQDLLDYLKEQYENASSEVDNAKLNIDEILTGENKEIFARQKSSKVSKIYINRANNSFAFIRDMFMNVIPKSWTEGQLNGENIWYIPEDPEIAKDDAYDKAADYLDQLNIDLDLYSAEPCSLLTDSTDLVTGWFFVFTRKLSNLQAEYSGGPWTYVNPDALPSYGSPWLPEVVTVAVDKEGICSLNWQGVSQIKSTLAETTKLENFNVIKKRIADQLNFVYGTHENADGIGLDITVDNIELGISLLSQKNRTDVGQYLPTWYVSFKSKWQDEQDSEENWYKNQIIFNAIDGSYVEPRVTNIDLMHNS